MNWNVSTSRGIIDLLFLPRKVENVSRTFLALPRITTEMLDSRSERQLDLDSAASGYGHDYYCPEGIPVETALFALLAAAGIAFGVLFMAITTITMPKKRKRREVDNLDSELSEGIVNPYLVLSSLAWQGNLVT